MFVILGRDAMSDCEEGLTEYLKGVWLKIRPGLSVMLGIIILIEFSVCYDCITKALEK